MVYFPSSGIVTLNLENDPKEFALKWINISTGEWGPTDQVKGGTWQKIQTPEESDHGWFAVLKGF